jgi:hypothetical protein
MAVAETGAEPPAEPRKEPAVTTPLAPEPAQNSTPSPRPEAGWRLDENGKLVLTWLPGTAADATMPITRAAQAA